jgi:hypothetical protein
MNEVPRRSPAVVNSSGQDALTGTGQFTGGERGMSHFLDPQIPLSETRLLASHLNFVRRLRVPS